MLRIKNKKYLKGIKNLNTQAKMYYQMVIQKYLQ